MPKPMHRLRAKMMEKDVELSDCVKAIGCSPGYWAPRIMGRRCFDMDDVYKLCDLLEIPYQDIPVYFPPIT